MVGGLFMKQKLFFIFLLNILLFTACSDNAADFGINTISYDYSGKLNRLYIYSYSNTQYLILYNTSDDSNYELVFKYTTPYDGSIHEKYNCPDELALISILWDKTLIDIRSFSGTVTTKNSGGSLWVEIKGQTDNPDNPVYIKGYTEITR